jgi:hypothetical protein
MLLACAVLLTGLPGSNGYGDESKKVAALMKRKLEQSQKVLEGVALNDFDKITKHAEELIAISKEAEWKVLKTPRYELYSTDFRRNSEGLIKNAKDKNLDAAALSYVELTLTCVKCHKHVREVRMVRAD